MVEIGCEDLSDLTCTGIDTGEGKRCIYLGEWKKCEEHSNSYNGLTQDKWEKNIPLDSTKKCSWVGSSCQEVNRKCSEYKFYIESSTNSYKNLCSGLESAASKACILIDNEKCEEVFEDCSSYKTENECKNDKPLTSDKLSYDPQNKCVWAGSKCSKELRKCSDYGKRNEDTEDTCGKLFSEVTGKICSFNNKTNICEEKYEDCESYNDNVELAKRKAEECGAIELRDLNYKCRFIKNTDNSYCQKFEVKCSDFDKEEECFKYQPRLDSYKCIFK